MKPYDLQTKEVDRFLNELTREKVLELISEQSKANFYYQSYPALLNLAETSRDDPENSELLALCCAIYGWMPTIPKQFDANNLNVKKPILTIKTIASNPDAKNLITSQIVSSPVNNSWVGLSKLLHFLNPKYFPIWDKVVANVFNAPNSSLHNQPSKYIAYINFVHTTLAEPPKYLDTVVDYFDNEYGYKPSKLRCLELLLFARGQELKQSNS